MLYLVALAWMYVVLMVAVAEALSPNGTAVGVAFTVIGWGVLPLSVVLYILSTPARRRARRAAQDAAQVAAQGAVQAAAMAASGAQPDPGGHAAGDPVAPERKEA
jgi:predicted membrane channel-forming protein YqfA (hemolysin III family)